MKKVFKLKDLRLTEANREIAEKHVDRLVELIRKNGYIEGMPIIVDEDGFIIDGQHRYLACKKLGIEPPIVLGKNFDIVPFLNSTQLKWTVKDYVNYYVVKGYPDFIILDQLCKKKNISPSIAYNIIFNKSTDRTGLSRGVRIYPLKDGTMKLPDTSEKGLQKLERKVDMVLSLINLLNLPKTDRLIIAISRIISDKNFSYAVMQNKIDFQKSRIYRCSTIQEYMQMIANIYNYKNSNKITV